LDDITFRPCGPQITETIDGQPATTKSFCEGPQQSIIFGANISGGLIGPAYQWQSRSSLSSSWVDIPLANSNTLVKTFLQNTPPGVFEFRLAVAASGNINSSQCRTYSRPFVITIHPNPVIAITNNSAVCEKGSLSLLASGGVQYQWSGPNGFMANGSTLQINNIQLNQGGKYYVTGTSAAGCINKDSAIVVVNPSPDVTTTFSSADICTGDSVQLLSSGSITYLWMPANGLSMNNISNPKASPSQSVQYVVIGSNQFSCSDTASIDITVHAKPIAGAGPDKIIFKGESITLSGSVNTTGNYYWSPPVAIDNINSLQPVVNPSVDTWYVLHLVSGFGCGTSTDSTFVKVFDKIFIPNAFSPNGDNINDTWSVMGISACPHFEISV
jgi:hypothetical protein